MSKKVRVMNESGTESWEDSPLFKKDIGAADGVAGLDANKQPPPTVKASGTITRAASAGSGSVAVTGLGFRPSIVHLVAADDNLLGNNSSGWSDGVINVSNSNIAASLVSCIEIVSIGNGHSATVVMDSDGFTVTWTKVGQGLNLTAKYLAIK